MKERVEMLCCECEKVFSATVGPRTYEVRCPRCHGYDTMPTGEPVHRASRAKGPVPVGLKESPGAARPVSAAPGSELLGACKAAWEVARTAKTFCPEILDILGPAITKAESEGR